MKVLVLPGPTRDYPEGKLREDDRGGLMMKLEVEGDKLILRFGVPVDWIGLGPSDCRALAAKLLEFADARRPC
jgi:hypothetical protein